VLPSERGAITLTGLHCVIPGRKQLADLCSHCGRFPIAKSGLMLFWAVRKLLPGNRRNQREFVRAPPEVAREKAIIYEDFAHISVNSGFQSQVEAEQQGPQTSI